MCKTDKMDPFKIVSLKKESFQLLEIFNPPIKRVETNGIFHANPHYQTLFRNETTEWLHFSPKRGWNPRLEKLIKGPFQKIVTQKQSFQLLENPPILDAETNGTSYANPQRRNPPGKYMNVA